MPNDILEATERAGRELAQSMAVSADGQQMFMEQKYTVDGDLAIMLKLFEKEG